MSEHLEAIRSARTQLVRAEEDYQAAIQAAEEERLRLFRREANLSPAYVPEITKGSIAEAAGVSRQTLDAMLKRRNAA